MKCECGIILLVLTYASCQLEELLGLLPNIIAENLSTDPDKNLDTKTFIASRGFNWELYQVPTGDGYVIDVYRVVHPFKAATKRPVLFAPVSGGNSIEWLRNSAGGNVNESTDVVGPNIGFEAAKRGYDVWLMNWRGGSYFANGFRQEKYNPLTDRRYYEYTIDEYALFDLPAAMDLVRNVTGKQKIAYVGLLDSTTPYFMLAATVPRFNSQIQPMIALAPAWTQFNSTNPSTEQIQATQRSVQALVAQGGPDFPILTAEILSRILCNLKVTQRLLCNPIILYLLQRVVLAGGKTGSVNYDRLTVLAATAEGFTRGSNWMQAQETTFAVSQRVKMLNVNPEVNTQRYGSVPTPEYLPERITNPDIHFINGESNVAFTVADMGIFKQRLGTRIRSERNVPAFVGWSILSFQDGRPDDVIKWVNTPVLQILDSYN